MQFLVVQIDTAGRIIDFQLPIDKYRRFVGRALLRDQPPLSDPQTGQQLFHGKGLGQVIVRAGVQRPDFIRIPRCGR